MNPRSVALQGFGFGVPAIARQGFFNSSQSYSIGGGRRKKTKKRRAEEALVLHRAYLL
jgi:hypothetical protein